MKSRKVECQNVELLAPRVFLNGIWKRVPHALATRLKHVEYAFITRLSRVEYAWNTGLKRSVLNEVLNIRFKRLNNSLMILFILWRNFILNYLKVILFAIKVNYLPLITIYKRNCSLRIIWKTKIYLKTQAYK